MKNNFAMIMLVAIAGNMMAVNCQRTVSVISANEMKVEITITKDQSKSFARLAENLPAGSIIKYAKTEGGTFMVQDDKLKFIWLALPQKNVVTASYTILTEAMKEGVYSINGKFSYVEGEETKEFDIPSSSFNINSSQVASVGTVAPYTNTLTNKNTTSTEKTETATTSEKNGTSTANLSKVTYALQLVSTKDRLANDYFSQKYQVVEPVKVETANGINKYMLGDYKSLKEATESRESLGKKGFKDAFIVAYLNNKRITLEEAKQLESGK